jgi:hypothetical protein
MQKNKEKQAEIKVEEIEKISETQKVGESIEEPTKPAVVDELAETNVEESKEESTETAKPAKTGKQEKNKEKVEVIHNGTPRMNKFNQLNQK